MHNDADYYYFRITLWHDIEPGAGQFPAYANILYDTDDNASTGFDAVGSEMLNQSGSGFDQRNGEFNDGDVNGLGWLCMPDVPGVAVRSYRSISRSVNVVRT